MVSSTKSTNHITSYASALDASTYVYASEIWPTHLRARGCAISVAGLFVSSLILLCAASDAFAAIGWRYYLVFLCMTLLGAVFFALVFPEVCCSAPPECDAVIAKMFVPF